MKSVLRAIAQSAVVLSLSGAALAVTTAGCGDLKKGFEQSFELSKDIKSELGVDANVQFKIMNGKKTVEVTLSSTPSGDAAELKTKVETLAKKRFPDADEIVVHL